MSPLSVEGIYTDGRVEFTEPPVGMPDGARVRVTVVGPSRADEPTRETLREEAFARMKRGTDFGGPPYPSREEIYDERLRELERRRGG